MRTPDDRTNIGNLYGESQVRHMNIFFSDIEHVLTNIKPLNQAIAPA